MDTLRQALQGSIIELLDSIQRLKWHIEATKDEKDAQEKRVLVQLIMKERDVLAFIPTTVRSPRTKPASPSPSASKGIEKFVVDSTNAIIGLEEKLSSLLELIEGEKDRDILLEYAKSIKEAAKIFNEDFEDYLSSRPCEVRYLCELFVRVAEAKSLPGKDFTGNSDPYCVVSVDNEKLGKTQTIWRTVNPCWLKDFNFDIPVNAKSVHFTIYDRDKAKQDEFLGEAAIALNTLKNGTLLECWSPLLPKGYGRAIFSKIHIKSKYKPGALHTTGNLFVTVVDVTDIETTEVVVSLIRGESTEPGSNFQTYHTAVKKETDICEPNKRTWNETFSFRFSLEKLDEYKVGLFCCKGKSIVADAYLPLSSAVAEASSEYETEQTLDLKVRPFKKLGELRVQLKRITYKILDTHVYDELLMLMLRDDETVRYISELCENVGRRKDIIRSIICVLTDRGVVEEFLKRITEIEIKNTPDTGTLFRANSFSALCVDAYINLVGNDLLQKVLKDIILDIYRSKKSCEVDPSRLKSSSLLPGGENVTKNLEHLIQRVTAIWERIQACVDDVPSVFRSILAHLQATTSAQWPNEPNVRYLAPSGFLFLRFFCAAILGPHLFQLIDEYPENKVARNLTLISKTLMSLGNLVLFGSKEPWLVPVNGFIEENIPKMKAYIDAVATPGAGPNPKPRVSYEKEMAHIQSFLSEVKPKIEADARNTESMKLARLLGVLDRLERALEAHGSRQKENITPPKPLIPKSKRFRRALSVSPTSANRQKPKKRGSVSVVEL